MVNIQKESGHAMHIPAQAKGAKMNSNFKTMAMTFVVGALLAVALTSCRGTKESPAELEDQAFADL